MKKNIILTLFFLPALVLAQVDRDTFTLCNNVTITTEYGYASHKVVVKSSVNFMDEVDLSCVPGVLFAVKKNWYVQELVLDPDIAPSIFTKNLLDEISLFWCSEPFERTPTGLSGRIGFTSRPLVFFQKTDTVTYWFSAEQLRIMTGIFVNYRTNYAPNGMQYTCMCHSGRNMCGDFEDMELVCMTVDGVVQILDNEPMSISATKTDTVEVRVICEARGGLDWLGTTLMAVFVTKQKERTLEWKTWDINPLPYVYSQKSDWVVVKSRWLHSIDGCYELVPLRQE